VAANFFCQFDMGATAEDDNCSHEGSPWLVYARLDTAF
jgi:hypothetical protein